MKIFSAKQLQEADKITIENQNISSTDLMERAAGMVFEQIHARLQGADIPIKIFCGIGNNGGDGLVVARLLTEYGYNTKVFVVNYTDQRSGDFLENYDRFKNITNDWPELITGQDNFPKLKKGDFIIDAIFGIGLNRPIEGWVGSLVQHINDAEAFVLSIDIPSGLFADDVPGESAPVIKASFTLSFQSPKLVFFLPQTMDYVGDFQVLDIGLDRDHLAKTSTKYRLIAKPQARLLYKNRNKNSHKGDYGHSLIIGGSYGKIGSIVLAASAALRAGAGLCSVYVPSCGNSILQTSVPEAMVISDLNKNHLTDINLDIEPDVICFGMGAGTHEETMKAFHELLENTEIPMLIDADGLNLLSENKDLLELLPKNSVLTPHPKELERLIGRWKNDIHKIKKVQEFVEKHEVNLVLKGAYTFCFSKKEIFINSSGNPGMATAGSGDTLSGIITGLISQQYEPAVAKVFGVYLHGLAGDIAAQKLGYEALIAGDIIKNLGAAYKELFREENSEELKESK